MAGIKIPRLKFKPARNFGGIPTRFRPQYERNMSETWAAWLAESMEWIRDHGLVGCLWFIVLYVVSGALFLPGSILTLGAGAVYGWGPGTLLVSIASTIGAALNFFTSRYLARQWIERRLESRPRFRSLAHAVGAKGWPLILISRFSPVFPHSIVSYAAGMTRIHGWVFLVASFVGFLPLSAAYSYAGAVLGRVALLKSGNFTDDPFSVGVAVASVVVTLLVTALSAQFVAKAFANASKEPE